MTPLRTVAICSCLCMLIALLQLLPFWLGLDLSSVDMSFYWHAIRRDFFQTRSLWYDQILNGTSLLANPLYGLFYVPNVVYLLFPAAVAVRVYVLLHYALLGAGAGLWATLAGEKTPIAACTAALLAGSGVVLSMPGRDLPYLAAASWLPLIAASALWTGRQRQPLLLGFAGALTGIGVCAGDIQMLAYGPVFAAAGLASGCALPQPRVQLLRQPGIGLWLSRAAAGLGAVAAFMAGCLATSGVVLVHAWSSWQLSPRAQGLTAAEALAFSFHPLRLLEFFWPVFGRPGTADFHGQMYTSSLYGHVWWYPNVDFGPAALVVLIAGIRYCRRPSWLPCSCCCGVSASGTRPWPG